MARKKTLILTISAALLAVLTLAVVFTALHVKAQVRDLFRMNRKLQEEGYYMGEFEFKMLGLAYWLDKGHYFKALSALNKLHKQMESKEGLAKIPRFANRMDEMEFYLSLQNPRTGAFMDDAYPYSTYTGPTGNVLAHLDALAGETHRPLKLKYRLKYLDEIDTPEKLHAYLDDVSTVGWIALKFPQTTFHSARDLLSLFFEESVVEKHNLHNASSEWKRALLQWFYDNQDPGTGAWGPKSKSGKLLKRDTMNSASIIKAFVDGHGNSLHPDFPLKHGNELARTILEESFFGHLPEDDDLPGWHEWNLNTPKSIRTVTRYLWKDLSQGSKDRTRRLIEHHVRIEFERFYIPDEGAFSYYPNSAHATLDGTGGAIRAFADYGFFSAKTQERLWGSPKACITDLGTYRVSRLSENDLSPAAGSSDVNSVRLYATDVDYRNLVSGVFAVVYPKETPVLDVMDLIPRTRRWIETTPQRMGNWVSGESTAQELKRVEIKREVRIYRNGFPLEEANEVLHRKGALAAIGFDVLQVPRCRVTFTVR